VIEAMGVNYTCILVAPRLDQVVYRFRDAVPDAIGVRLSGLRVPSLVLAGAAQIDDVRHASTVFPALPS